MIKISGFTFPVYSPIQPAKPLESLQTQLTDPTADLAA